MKKVFFYSIIVASTMFFSSCGSDTSLVRETGEKFMKAIVAGDLTTVKTMVTPETLEKWGNSATILDEALAPEIKGKLQSVKIKASDVVVNGDKAQATLSVGIPAEGGEITVLHFRKDGKLWLVHEPGILVKKVLKEETVITDTEW